VKIAQISGVRYERYALQVSFNGAGLGWSVMGSGFSVSIKRIFTIASVVFGGLYLSAMNNKLSNNLS